MENKVNPNGVNENEKNGVKKAAPPPMKYADKKAKGVATPVTPKKPLEKKEAVKKEEPKKEEVKKEEPKKQEEETKVVPPVVVDELPEEKPQEEKKEAAPVVAPVTPKKEEKKEEIKKPKITAIPLKKKIDKKSLKIIIPIVAVLLIAIIVAVVLVSQSGKEDPIVVTDANGVPVTDLDGNVITVTPEKEVIELTDANGNVIKDSEGNPLTTVVYKDLTVNVPMTDMNGVVVTNFDGKVVTTNISVNPTSKNPVSTSKNENVVGSTVVAVTDGKGNTGVDSQGNLITTIVNITNPPVIDIEPAKTEWKNTKGGSKTDKYEDVILTSDGCYITSNVTLSKDGDFSKFKDASLSVPYTVLTKYSKSGDVIWEKAYGSADGMLELTDLSACSDGSFYATGQGKAVGTLPIKGWYDIALYKIDANGDVIWYKSFGTSTVDLAKDVVTTSDGSAVVVGSIGNNDGDAAGSGGNKNESKAVMLKYSPDGSLIFKKYAGGNMDVFTGVVEGTDGSLFVLGNFYSGKLFDALGKCDSGIVKYAKDGRLLKKTSIAGTGIDEFTGITATSDGGVVVCGASDSSDTKESSFFKNDLVARGGYDSYVIKYTNDLVIKFATPVRGQNNDVATSVMELNDGTYLVAGSTNSSTRDFKGVTTRGMKDIYVASLNSSGDLCWVRSFGGTQNDGALAICKGADGGYVVVGETFSNDVDLNNIAKFGGNGKTLGIMVKFPE